MKKLKLKLSMRQYMTIGMLFFDGNGKLVNEVAYIDGTNPQYEIVFYDESFMNAIIQLIQ